MQGGVAPSRGALARFGSRRAAQEASTTMKTTVRTPNRGALLLAIVAVLAACQVGSTATPTPSVCDGVSSELGGCDLSVRHTFTGTTCEAVGSEWGTVLDRAIVEILKGPEEVDGNGRSVRLQQALVITTGDANQHLRRQGLIAECGVPEFLAAGTPHFSADLQSGIGAAHFDGNPMSSYGEWLGDIQSVVRMIDQDE